MHLLLLSIVSGFLFLFGLFVELALPASGSNAWSVVWNETNFSAVVVKSMIASSREVPKAFLSSAVVELLHLQVTF